MERSYRLSATMPAEERYGLTAQIRRDAASLPANIAEGFGRWNSREFSGFLSIANGSLRELETHLVIAFRVGILSGPELEELFSKIDELARMLYSFRLKVNSLFKITSAGCASISPGPKTPSAPK